MTGRPSRRRVLTVLGCGLGGTAGCIDGLGGPRDDAVPPDDDAAPTGTDRPGTGALDGTDLADGWASFGADARNTGHLQTDGPSDPEIAWEFETTATIFDGVAAVDDRVFVGSTDGNVYAVDAESGDEEWRFPPEGQVRTTPAVADGMVYVAGRDGGLSALERATGAHRWTTLVDEGFVLSHPTVAGGSLYVASRRGELHAVDAATGDVRWRYELGGRGLSSPAVGDGTIYVGWRGEPSGPGPNEGGGIAALTPDGEEVWRHEPGDGDGSATVADGVVYAGIGSALFAYDAADGTELWRFESEGRFASPAIADGTVFAASSDTNVYGIDAASGEELWRFDPVNRMNYAPAVADGLVYVAGWTGRVSGLDVTDGEKRWAVQLETPLSDPAVHDGTVYVATENALVALRDG